MTHKTLGELILTDFDAARPILEVWARGKPLEWYDGRNNWTDWQSFSTLISGNTYRIPPRHHTVDWSQVGERILAFETGVDGMHWGIDGNNHTHRADLWPSFRPGTMPWQESRINRPKEVK